MTPKEKAWELYHKYRTLEGKFGEKVLYNYEAKECALIAVDEIINDNPNIYDSDRLNYKYWNEVKQEINKI